eukprot:m.376158 g.376158  ORF g.376158 m.376158 type:complete len:92 (-) comp56185_c0_seq23:564-839(-)
MNPEHVFHYLTPDEIKSILPSKRIVPVTFKVEAGKSLLIGGVARVDFEQGPAATILPPLSFAFAAIRCLHMMQATILRCSRSLARTTSRPI